MKQYKMWIGGKWVEAESGKTYPVYNPATELEVAQVPLGGQAEVDKAVAGGTKSLADMVNKITGRAFAACFKTGGTVA